MKEVINVKNYEGELNILERAYLEVQGRQNILAFMVSNNMHHDETYKDYWEEFLEYSKAYRIIGDNFIQNIVKPQCKDIANINNWIVNFDRQEVTIYGD